MAKVTEVVTGTQLCQIAAIAAIRTVTEVMATSSLGKEGGELAEVMTLEALMQAVVAQAHKFDLSRDFTCAQVATTWDKLLPN